MLKFKNLKEPKSTILGLIGLIITGAVILGYMDEGKSIELNEALTGIVAGVFSIIALFAKPVEEKEEIEE